ncbi:DcrB-related protein [Chondromyces crocatus]|uniref:DUF1795 domain-containing protein n=1 Tax=Chondromyces crocatus TaxID=52 RepID=A0A0K1ENJ8_CHOCO|nr:DcrB-related protein [Chondromyces crocatus]AKT42212.1 uncharacterized protein CMC5_064350 [Chondromyces crocatus]
MAAYETDEARFDVPASWLDRSVTSLEYSSPEGVTRVVVQREPTEQRTLKDLHTARLVDLRRRLAAFELILEEEVLVAGRAAVELGMRYRDEDAHLYQHAVTLIVGEKLVTVGVLGPVKAGEHIDALFQRLRATITIRDAEDT